jgi:hypothetical protein
MDKLTLIQNEIKVPKSNYNSFGKYKFRSVEDIQTALKPLLLKHGCTLLISDSVHSIEGIQFITATVTITESEGKSHTVAASAGIDLNQKGMSIAQSFGSSSSYARKYALGGLLLLDDIADADQTNKHGKSESEDLATKITEAKSLAELADLYNNNKEISQSPALMKLIKDKKEKFNGSAV